MKLVVDDIKEVKVVTVDVDKKFIHFDELPNGKWRCVYSKSLDGKVIFEEREAGDYK